jgi:hypothetical protein
MLFAYFFGHTKKYYRLKKQSAYNKDLVSLEKPSQFIKYLSRLAKSSLKHVAQLLNWYHLKHKNVFN